MRQIFEIAARELRSMFYSPIGWLTLIVFTLHVAFMLNGKLDNANIMFELRGEDQNNYTLIWFSNLSGVFRMTATILYLYIPLLTMGLLSKEYNDGGIKLLFSSPIKTCEIVIGKFLALATYGFLMVVQIVILGILSRFFLLDMFDVSLFFSGVFQLYLIILLYIGIGLFISSLTSYQLASAVGTFAVLFLINTYLSTLVRESHPEIIQLLFGIWLSPNSHFEGFWGLINSGDLFYFAILTLLFLTLTYLRLRFLRESWNYFIKSFAFIFVVILTISIGLYTYIPSQYKFYDWTDKKRHSFSKEQSQVFSQLEHPLTFTRYINILESPSDGSLMGFGGRIRSIPRISRSLKLKPDIDYIPFYAHTSYLNLAYLNDETAYSDATVLATQTPNQLNRSTYDRDLFELTKSATQLYSWINEEEILTPNEISEIFDTTLSNYSNAYIVESGSQSKILRIGPISPTDQELTAIVKTMLIGPNLIGFISGNGERSPFSTNDKDYFRIFNNHQSQYSLINQGFEFLSIDLNDSTRTNDLNLNILVIADPLQEYNESQLQKIREYLEQGVNIFIVFSSLNVRNIEPIAKELGITTVERVIDYSTANILPSAIIQPDNDGILVEQIMVYRSRNAKLLTKTGEGSEINIRNATSLNKSTQTPEFNYIPLVVSGEDTLMYALSRRINNRDQRIVISGDADFMSNGIEGIGFQSAYGVEKVNFALAVTLFRWLSNDEYPVLVEREKQIETLNPSNIDLMKTIMVWIIPLPLIVFGMWVVYNRKRK